MNESKHERSDDQGRSAALLQGLRARADELNADLLTFLSQAARAQPETAQAFH
jgi:hypothetical protein